MIFRHIPLLVCLLISVTAQAGITIHFKGEADGNVQQIVNKACTIAEVNNWKCDRVSESEIEDRDRITAKSVMELEDANTLTGATGAAIYMHEMSEPLYLVFSASGKIDNFVKTQFAGPDIHKQAVELFDQIQPMFRSLYLEDESGYWINRDSDAMAKEFMGVDLMMKNILSQRPDVHGPIIVNGGRIIDLKQKNR